MTQLHKEASKNKTWAINILSSWGKVLDGFFKNGNTLCIWNSQYCIVYLKIKTIPVKYGICIPESCNPQYIFHNFEKYLAKYYQTFPNSFKPIIAYRIMCKYHENDKLIHESKTTSFILFTTFSVIIVAILTISEKLLRHSDIIQTNKKIKIIYQFLKCISIENNVLFLIRRRKGDDNISRCLQTLDGIRVLSMIWIFYCHIYLELGIFSKNPLFLYKQSSSFFFQTIINGNTPVDSFFYISGLLVGLNFLTKYSKLENEKKIIKLKFLGLFYLHRIIRLWPTYIMVIWATIAIVRPILLRNLNGMLSDDHFYTCIKHWTRNILFINNCYSVKNQCLPWTWYLAANTQMYFISPILLTLFHYGKFTGRIFMIFCIFISIGTTGIVYNFFPKWMSALSNNKIDKKIVNEMRYESQITVTRFGPFVVGMLFSTILFKMKTTSYQFKLTGVVFGIYRDYRKWQMKWKEGISKYILILYYSTKRTLWAVMLSMFIWSFANGYEAVIYDTLEYAYYDNYFSNHHLLFINLDNAAN
ncbi:hypothetical protein SNEBB_009931 [Seison nebaliae]|nr:hypothetical protein SNEBB_009931 [Seison nebaliae]